MALSSPLCLEERGDKGRGGQGTPSRGDAQGSLSLRVGEAAPGAESHLGSSITAMAHLSPRPDPLSCQSFRRCPLGSAVGQDQAVRGGLQGPPSQQGGGEQGDKCHFSALRGCSPNK